jgi:acylglycerol lipase
MGLGQAAMTSHFIKHYFASDGYDLACRVWPTPNPRGRVVVVHGIVSHSGWYVSCCEQLAQQGWEVHALDRRGSGLNCENRGDVSSMHRWLSDVEAYIQPWSDPLPTILLGISWGGKLVAFIAARGKCRLTGFGLICPGIYAKQQVGTFKQVGLKLANALGLNQLRVPIPLQDPRLFTEQPSSMTYIEQDPLTLREITVRFAVADLALNREARACAERIAIPGFLMLAGKERIVDNGRTRHFWSRLASNGNLVVEYPDAAHTLEFEEDPSAYYRDLCFQIDRIIRPRRRLA